MKIRTLIDWILQTAFLLMFFLLLYNFFVVNLFHNADIVLLSVFFFVWFIYQINSFTSEKFLFLLYFKPNLNVVNYLETLFGTKPTVNCYIDCFHYENFLHNNNANVNVNINQDKASNEIKINYSNYNNFNNLKEYSDNDLNLRKVMTFQDKKEFMFSQYRDISGIFIVGGNKEYYNRKKPSLLNLKLNLNVIYADKETEEELKFLKEESHENNKAKDTYTTVSEHFELEGLNKYNLISVNSKNNEFVHYILFILSSLIGLVEFYKLYLDLKSTYQEFEITKVISVNSKINIKTFANVINPTIIIGDETSEYCSESRQVLYKVLHEEEGEIKMEG